MLDPGDFSRPDWQALHDEAAALGNALVQGIALGRWTDLDEARAALAVPAGEVAGEGEVMA